MKLPILYAQMTDRQSVDLTLSVNPLGCSPLVLDKLRKIGAKEVSIYPLPDKLLTKLAIRFGVQKDNILLGSGSEQLIKLIAQSFIQPGDPVFIERGSFSLFVKESLLAKGKISLTTLSRIMKSDAKLIFLANPKTPTGEVIPQEVIKQIQKRTTGILVVDEANGEFIDDSSIRLSVNNSNLLVLRTFSKAFGLAGLRIGLAIGSKELVGQLKQVQQAFPVSQIAILLAQAALKDMEFIERTRRLITRERIFLQTELKKRGLGVSNSVTNNLFVSFPKANTLIEQLSRQGVSVINGSFFPGMKTPGFRISLKDRQTNQLFLKKLDKALGCLESKKLLRSKEEL